MTLDPVVAHFDCVADVYDEVLPFFATMAARAVELIAPAAGSARWTSRPDAGR